MVIWLEIFVNNAAFCDSNKMEAHSTKSIQKSLKNGPGFRYGPGPGI